MRGAPAGGFFRRAQGGAERVARRPCAHVNRDTCRCAPTDALRTCVRGCGSHVAAAARWRPPLTCLARVWPTACGPREGAADPPSAAIPSLPRARSRRAGHGSVGSRKSCCGRGLNGARDRVTPNGPRDSHVPPLDS